MLNLKARFPRYRIAREEGSEQNDPAGWIIPAKYGHVYAHSEELLAVATIGRGIVRRLLTVPGLRIVQDGSDGANCIFPPTSFDAVAGIIRAKRRRQLSPKQRARLIAAGEKTRRKSAVQASGTRSDAANGSEAVLAA